MPARLRIVFGDTSVLEYASRYVDAKDGGEEVYVIKYIVENGPLEQSSLCPLSLLSEV
jgi:hypothetical protein